MGTYHDISNIITEEKVVNKEIEKQQELEEVCIFNLPSSFSVEFLQKVQETLRNLRNLFQIDNKDAKDTHLMSFWCLDF